MCIHRSLKTYQQLDLYKISDKIKPMQTDISIINEFSNSCNYHESDNELMVYQNDLSVMHLNIRSLLPKQHDFRHLLKQSFVDICLLNETWLTADNKGLVDVGGYDFIS